MDTATDISVLYINDDSQLLEIVSTQLTNESERLDVRTATSADRGWDVLEANAVDCILCDYHMPDETGVEFLQRVREAYPDIPFLLFTETGSETVASESIEAGVTDYIIQDVIGNQAQLLAQKILTHVEHRRSEREIEQRDRQLREIVSVTDQGMWVFSPDWSEVRFINDEYESLFGQSVAALRADPTSFLEQVHPDDVARLEVAMERASAGEAQRVEYRVEKSEAAQLWVASQCKPVTDENGTVTAIVGVTREITDRKVYQRELVEKIDRLEEFTSTVSHDLRNPMNVIDGNVRLAAMDHDSEHLDAALDAVKRMGTLLEELLGLAKDGELIDDREEVEFDEVMTRSYENVHAPSASLHVAESMPLLCDPVRVTEALENLVRNAVEHGSSDVALTAGLLADHRGVYVEDDGPGIPATERDDIFEKGYTTRADGSGFGLAIVDRIVSAHGWDIRAAESSTGGARFEIVTGDS